MLHFALLPVRNKKKHKTERRLAGSPDRPRRFPVAHHLCTRQNLATAITMEASTKERGLVGDQEVKNDGWRTDNEAGHPDRAKLVGLVAHVAPSAASV